ncbi:MAG TPA: hypothetical protein P5022_15305 [Candidatus Paceibacterota bacterium]|nr:hypothetical protein [Candidatus Paceibacterota bacterium]
MLGWFAMAAVAAQAQIFLDGVYDFTGTPGSLAATENTPYIEYSSVITTGLTQDPTPANILSLSGFNAAGGGGATPYTGDHIKIVLTATELLYDLELYSVTFRAGRSHMQFPQNVVVEFWADTGSGLSLRQTSAALALNKSTSPSNNNVGGLYTFDFNNLSGIRTAEIRFYVTSKDTPGGQFVYFDQISVAGAVPEPSSLGLATALLLIGFQIHKRSRS